MNHCKNLVNSSLQLNQKMRNRVDIKNQLEATSSCVNEIIALRSKIMPQLNLNQNQNLEQLLTQELTDMDKAIEEAVNKLEVNFIDWMQKCKSNSFIFLNSTANDGYIKETGYRSYIRSQ